jgi:hypothetical protein
MSDLGDLLELIHNAHAHVGTLEAEYREWTKPRPSLDLSVARGELGELKVSWREAGPFPRTLATTRRVWVRAPGHVRVEVVYGRQLVRIGVRDGSGWLRWDRTHGAMRGDLSEYEDGQSMVAPPLLFPPLIEPARLLAALSFEPAGKSKRLGRDVLVAHARPRYTSSPAERLELEFDAEHGTIVRRTTLEGDEPVSETEAVAVRYGSPIEPNRFELSLPDRQLVVQSGSQQRGDVVVPEPETE